MKTATLVRTTLFGAALAATNSAFAGYFSYNGDTTGGPTFTRAVEDGTAVSTVGTNVNYNVQKFSVDVDGTYLFASLATTPPTWDNLIFVYSNFDPSSPLAAYIDGSDDFDGVGNSAFTTTLTAGTYSLVTTGFDSDEFGGFSNSILGPGTVTPVPEPASMAALGIGALGLLRRRRKS